MSKCPYNDFVECSESCRVAGRTRQMNLALRAGLYWFDGATKFAATCEAQPWMCARLAAAKQGQR